MAMKWLWCDLCDRFWRLRSYKNGGGVMYGIPGHFIEPNRKRPQICSDCQTEIDANHETAEAVAERQPWIELVAFLSTVLGAGAIPIH